MTHIVFKPPSGDEAETTCESIWFLSSPRAPRQQQFVTTQGFRPSPPRRPPPRAPRKEQFAKSRIRELPGNFREVPGKFSRKSRDPPRDFPENPRGPRGIPRRISRGIRGKFFGNPEGFFPNGRHSTRRLIGRRLIPPNFGAEAATPSNICFVVVLPPRAPRKHTLVNTHSSHVFCTPRRSPGSTHLNTWSFEPPTAPRQHKFVNKTLFFCAEAARQGFFRPTGAPRQQQFVKTRGFGVPHKRRSRHNLRIRHRCFSPPPGRRGSTHL